MHGKQPYNEQLDCLDLKNKENINSLIDASVVIRRVHTKQKFASIYISHSK